MDNLRENDELVYEYLLGSLSEEETERLDELSISDDDFAARLQSAENDLVDLYVNGALTGRQLELFKSAYLKSPARRQKAEIAKALRAHGGPMNRVGTAEVDSEARTLPVDISSKRTRSISPIQWLTAAASILLLAIAVWLGIRNAELRSQYSATSSEVDQLKERQRELESQLNQNRLENSEKEKELEILREETARRTQRDRNGATDPIKPAIFSLILSPQTRGIGGIEQVVLPPDAQLVAIQLELERTEFPGYKAELKVLPGNRAVWRSGTLRSRGSADNKSVIATISTNLLPEGRYMLELTGVSGNQSEPVGTYVFQVSR